MKQPTGKKKSSVNKMRPKTDSCESPQDKLDTADSVLLTAR